MDLKREKLNSDYPTRFEVGVLRMAFVREKGDWSFHVIPLVKPKEIGRTIYHGYNEQDLSIPVEDLLRVFRKGITEDKQDGVWFLYCYVQDRQKGKKVLSDAVERDIKKPLMLGEGDDE